LTELQEERYKHYSKIESLLSIPDRQVRNDDDEIRRIKNEKLEHTAEIDSITSKMNDFKNMIHMRNVLEPEIKGFYDKKLEKTLLELFNEHNINENETEYILSVGFRYSEIE
jgi:hypothetical protein